MRILLWMSLVSIGWIVGCEQTSDECYIDDDCPAGQVCVISHDHEGDDHDHGGTCEDPQ